MTSAAGPLGMTRVQCVTAGAAIGLLAVGMATGQGRLVIVALAVGLLAAGRPEHSPADLAVRAAHYLRRSHRSVTRSTSPRERYVLAHRGRLDLAGQEESVSVDLARVLESVAASGAGLVSWHGLATDRGLVTVLAVPTGIVPPSRWAPLHHDDGPASPVLERWGYLRDSTGLHCALELSDVGPSGSDAALIALSREVDGRDLHVVCRVLPAASAARQAGRLAHRLDAQGAIAAHLGIRRRAGHDVATDATARRERSVAEGHALCSLDVVVEVRAADRRELERRVSNVLDDARRAGARLRRANGRHAPLLRLASLS